MSLFTDDRIKPDNSSYVLAYIYFGLAADIAF